jgi:iron(III) transport system substrate-binding protein
MTRPRLPHVGVAALAVLGLGLPACSSGSSDSVTVYSGRSEDLVGPLLEQFADETGVDIEVRYGDSADLALQIATEGDQTPADVFISQSPGAVSFLDAEGLLDELDAGALDAVDEQHRASDGHWVGLSGRRRVLVYNEEMVDEADLPASVLDLTDPAYEGQVGVAPSNASFQDFVSVMRASIGDDETRAWLDGMADNDAQTYPNNIAIVEAVGRGEIPFGLVNHYYNEQALADDPDLPSRNHYFPADDLGALVLVSAATRLASSDVPDDADRLIEFLLGDEAQTFFTEETLEYPLAAGVEPAEGLPPLEGLPLSEIDEDLGSDFEGTIEMIDESGLG